MHLKILRCPQDGLRSASVGAKPTSTGRCAPPAGRNAPARPVYSCTLFQRGSPWADALEAIMTVPGLAAFSWAVASASSSGL